MKKIIVILLCIYFKINYAYSSEFIDEIEKDYSLLSIGNLSVTNTKGDIHIEGKAIDKIKIKIRKTAIAENSEAAKKLFELADFRYQASGGGNIEISSQYNKELSIEERLHEGENTKIHSDIYISAPAKLKLKVWSINGKVILKNWHSGISIRSNSGTLQLENLKADEVSILCSSCAADLKNINASIRCMAGAGQIKLNNVSGKNIYIETSSGPIHLLNVQGGQLYISKSGPIEGQVLNGKIEFRAQESSVLLREVSGSLSGAVKTGDITATVKNWVFTDKALIESLKGDIRLTLPKVFSGDIDVWSIHGQASVDFPTTSIQESPNSSNSAASNLNHIVGTVKDGGELLKIFTTDGNIHVFKGKL